MVAIECAGRFSGIRSRISLDPSVPCGNVDAVEMTPEGCEARAQRAAVARRGKNDGDAGGGRVTEDRRAHIARLRARLRELRDDFAFVEDEYRAGRITLAEEVA